MRFTKGDCSSAQFLAAAVPVESVFMELQSNLPKADPGRDLLAIFGGLSTGISRDES